MAKNRWIEKAIKRPGALRKKARSAGLIKGNEKLSDTDVSTLSSMGKKDKDTLLMRQAVLARTLKKMKK